MNSNYRYRIALPEELISITERDLWEFQQKISHCRYRFSLEFQLISITDTDFGLKTNEFCNHFGYNGTLRIFTDLFSRVLFSFLPLGWPRLFLLAPFHPFLPLVKCSVL